MIIEYSVIYADGRKTLQELVNEAIKNGWQPLGGIGVSVLWLRGECRNVVEDERLYQAIVKTAKD